LLKRDSPTKNPAEDGFDPITIEDSDKICRMQQAINNISFQREDSAPVEATHKR
jgi:hypothetical protein